MGLKVAIIGGRSSYTPKIIEELIDRYHTLPCTEIQLINPRCSAYYLPAIK